MNLNKKILTLLAIFCIIASAGLAFAADQDGYAGINYEDSNGVSGSQYYVNEANQTTLEPGAGLPLENQTGYVPLDANGNPIHNATNINGTGNATSNATAHTTGNVTHQTNNATAAHTLPATGNPIVALLVVSSLIGGYAVTKRKQ